MEWMWQSSRVPDESALERAILRYWEVRKAQAARQASAGSVDAGLRGAVTGGAQLDGLAELLEETFVELGLPRDAVRRSSNIELPGYYRPTKKWDLVVVHGGVLVAAIELKSQVGPSFGNNFNNRIEEGLGNAVDVWRAYEEGTFGAVRPWLGYIFLLEDAPASTRPVKVARSIFPAEPAFTETSYAQRYQIFCRRLVRERLYDAACFLMSSSETGSPVTQPDPELGFLHFLAALAGRTAYILAQ